MLCINEFGSIECIEESDIRVNQSQFRMGGTNSKDLTHPPDSNNFPSDDKFFGFENFGNTCYANSVLQSLYASPQFRSKVIEYYESHKDKKTENLLFSLGELFHEYSTQKKSNGKIAPKPFITRLRKDNELFSTYNQQDAHEFLNFLTNHISELLTRDKEHNFIHELCQGTLSNETRCITCDHISSRDESFLDLSIEVTGNTSVTWCFHKFSSKETIKGEDKFYCDQCNSLQEAQKCIKIKKLPRVLILHLKRFKYSEKLNAYKKLQDRVSFPFDFKLDSVEHDHHYQLFGVVNHIGSGPTYGHYKAMTKTEGLWVSFDDDLVKISSEKQVQSIFGFPNGDLAGSSETGYILFYEC